MSLYVPVDDSISIEGSIVSVEAFSAVATAIAYLMDSMPVGSIVPIMTGFPNVPIPNPLVWQPCDGTPVGNQNSPIRNQASTDLTTDVQFIKGASSAGVAGQSGGTLTKNFEHSHGGATGFAIRGPDDVGQTTNEGTRPVASDHAHSIGNDLVTPYDMQPAHIRVQFYLKIL